MVMVTQFMTIENKIQCTSSYKRAIDEKIEKQTSFCLVKKLLCYTDGQVQQSADYQLELGGRGSALCSWARYFTLIVPLSTQLYKWVLANLLLGATLRWTSIPSRGE